MKILQHSHIGQRENNEDSLSFNKNVFVVCDGVGGQVKGEAASEFIAQYLSENYNKEYTKEQIQNLISDAQRALNHLLLQQPELSGMATTLVAVFKTDNGYFVAHIGDSRVYIINEQKSGYWRTNDHSLVEELRKVGGITDVEANQHPRKNEITRAIVANSENKIAPADITHFQNLKEGTILLLCTDGVNEVLSDEELMDLLSSPFLLEEKKESLVELTSLANDNHTFLLLELEEKDEIEFIDEHPIVWSPIEKIDLEELEKTVDIEELEKTVNLEAESEVKYPIENSVNSKSLLRKLIPFIAIAALILLFVLFQKFIK